MRRGIASVVAVGLLLGAVVAGAEVVKVGELGIISDAPLYIALERGYFKERGIDVQFVRFTSAAPAMAHVSTGEVQVAGGGISPTLFNAFARGFPVKVVAPRTREVAERSINALMVRADLKDQIHNYAGLKGRKVAVNASGSALVYVLGKMAEAGGLSLKDIDVVYIPFPEIGTAFSTKAIDAAIVAEPFVAQFEEKGYAHALRRTADVVKDPWMELAVIFYNADWAKKNARLAGDFMAAYLKGARDFDVAANRGPNRDEVVAIMSKHTRVKDKNLYERMVWTYTDPNGSLLKESIREQQEWYVKEGKVAKRADVDDMIDEQYVKRALQELGPYRGGR